MVLKDILDRIHKSDVRPVIAVAAAADEEVIASVALAIKEQLADFLLFGNEDKIQFLLQRYSIMNEPGIKVMSVRDDEAAQEAVKAVSESKAHVLMKGLIPTAVLLKEVLNKEYGLRTGRLLSHVAAFEILGYDRLIYVTDAGMNIQPDTNQKAEIIQNAIDFVQSMGTAIPKVAILAAVETVNPAMQATLDASKLVEMHEKGIINGGVIQGPLALDNAISIESAEHKGISGEVAGKADILVVPAIETGNVLYKSLVYFAGAKVGAVICGASVPIVLTSRSDSAESKFYSIALAVQSILNKHHQL